MPPEDELQDAMPEEEEEEEKNGLEAVNGAPWRDWLSAEVSALEEDLLVELRTKEQQPPPCFVPIENTCPYCPGPTPPALNPCQTVTTQAVVYGINYVQKACSNGVRFQEYTSGFPNFNNRVLLTLPLCELLLSGLAMPLPSNVKTARHRQRVNSEPAARAEYLARRQESYQRRKQQGKIPYVKSSELPERERDKKTEREMEGCIKCLQGEEKDGKCCLRPYTAIDGEYSTSSG
ncbi:uncharacterized protein LOC119013056 [Scomber scombrus]|uniref:Uncharacterized protein LOC119013056 n=1 Tax=Scomber scombrus TaxID=13677 RepID=A0AAV1NTG2_SCOSC